MNRLVLLAALVLLSACADDNEKYVEKPVGVLYNDAMDSLQESQYSDAAKGFEEVERQHPYSIWATRAEIMAAYAHYKQGDYDSATSELDQFIQLHPGNPDTPYAYYLKGLSAYSQISDVGRDQKMTADALASLQQVVDRYPGSIYSRDAKLKIDLAHDHLAGKEMEIGRFYETRMLYLSAINRFQHVIVDYQTTSHVPEALHRLVECYTALGMTDEAKRTAAVLGHNFPASPWYKDAYGLATGGPEPGLSENEKGEVPWYHYLTFGLL